MGVKAHAGKSLRKTGDATSESAGVRIGIRPFEAKNKEAYVGKRFVRFQYGHRPLKARCKNYSPIKTATTKEVGKILKGAKSANF
jgi:hypothetical protein